MDVTVLVVAKAPVPGFAKTRLAAVIGDGPAADLAAAALLDTLEAVAGADVTHRIVALTGDVAHAVRSVELTAALQDFTVVAQRGHTFAQRLANAHADAQRATDAPVFQIGMDTPQVTAALLEQSSQPLTTGSACVLGPAEDGGWWALGVTDARFAAPIRDVPTSSPDTGRATLAAIESAGVAVHLLPVLRDVDHAADVAPVAARCRPGSRFRECAASLVDKAEVTLD